jgi:Raf kinase inhibitor-like YbhB/YbcL family protein
MQIIIKSAAFAEGEMIPREHTCDGKDISPALTWSPVPAGCKSVALICDDPDAPAGNWVHWVIFNISPAMTSLAANIAKEKNLNDGTRQGINDFHRIGYDGPCPPPGKPHRYFFKIYALDTMLGLQPGISKSDLLKAMDRHVLAQGELMGRYKR